MCCDLLGIGPAARARLGNLGVKGRSPIGLLPGIGARPTLLRGVTGEGRSEVHLSDDGPSKCNAT
jgi:hypothetical protein